VKRSWSLLAGLSLIAVGCIELGVDPASIGSIEFPPPSSPSLVLGDTLRDAAGVPERLKARVFTTGGDEITDLEITYVNSDSLVRIVDGSLVVTSDTLLGTARVYAEAGGLQSNARTIEVVRRPDSLAARTAIDTIAYSVPAVDTSTKVGFLVRSGSTGVGSIRVKLELLRDGVALPAGDTTTYALVTPLGRVSAVDTTDTSGLVERIFRLRTVAGTAISDSLQVRATVVLGAKTLARTMTLRLVPAP
jgi:hypothetical protein